MMESIVILDNSRTPLRGKGQSQQNRGIWSGLNKKRVSVSMERWSSETKMPLNMSSSKVIKDVIFFGEIREKFAKWVGLFGKIIEHFPGFFWSAP